MLRWACFLICVVDLFRGDYQFAFVFFCIWWHTRVTIEKIEVKQPIVDVTLTTPATTKKKKS